MRFPLGLILGSLTVFGCASAMRQLPEACFTPTAAEMQAMGWDQQKILDIELLRVERCHAPAQAADAERRRIMRDAINESSRRLQELRNPPPRPIYQAPAYQRPLTCTSSRIGQQIYTNCY